MNTLTEVIDKNDFTQWENVKDRLQLRLVNTEWNRERLSHSPTTAFLNLSCTYHIVIEETEGGVATILVDDWHLEMWDKSIEELHQTALENAKKNQKEVLRPMQNVVEEFVFGEEAEELDELGTGRRFDLWVLTNEQRFYGAAALLYSEDIKKLSEMMECNLMILPSSVNELIIVPEILSGEYSVTFLQGMVSRVNEMDVDPEERLGDNVYLYHRESGEIEIAV